MAKSYPTNIHSLSRIGLLLLLCAFALNAHAGEWEVEHHDADPMKDNVAFTSYTYMNESMDAFICWSNTDRFCIYTPRVFNASYAGGTGGVSMMVTAGLYDADGNFIEKFDVYCRNYDGDYHALWTSQHDTKDSKRVLDHLRNTSGSVRIIAPVYSGAEMDIRIPSLIEYYEHKDNNL